MNSPSDSSQSSSSGLWGMLLPEECYSASIFMKELTYVAISHITSARNMFPKNAFVQRPFHGSSVEVLDPDCSLPNVSILIAALFSAMKAIDAEYLRLMHVSVHRSCENLSEAIETYSFCFVYKQKTPDNLVIEALADSDATREEQVAEFLTKLRNFSQLFIEDLPKDSFLAVKVFFHENVTPPGYILPGFHRFTVSNRTDLCPPEAKKLRPSNSISLECVLNLETMAPCTVQKGNLHKSPRKLSFFDGETDSLFDFDSQKARESILKTTDSYPALNLPATKPMEETNGNVEEEDPVAKIVCPCGDSDEDGLLINCFFCQNWQHGICFRLFSAESAPEKHVCVACAKKYGEQCSDVELMKEVSDSALLTVCAFRRALAFCCIEPAITATTLQKHLAVKLGISRKIWSKLKTMGIVSSYRNLNNVDREKLREAMVEYFGQAGTAILFSVDDNQSSH